MQKISTNTYVETGFRGCNVGFVVTTQGVVVIDTPQMPADAVLWREEIGKFGPVLYVINTEPHGDHFTGNFFFEGTVISHEGTREAIKAASAEQLIERMKQMDTDSLGLMNGFEFRPPAITLSDRLTLHVGCHTFQLIHMPGHTPYQIAVFIPEERVVFTSDNVFGRVQAWLHQAVPDQWIESLKRLQQLEADVIVPGHGVLCDRSYLPEMAAFIQAWVDAVKAAMDKGLSVEEAQEKISFLDRYPVQPGMEAMAPMVQRMNVARLYQVLKK